MKKILSILLACCFVVGCMFTLTACGKSLSGSYKANLIAAEVDTNLALSAR